MAVPEDIKNIICARFPEGVECAVDSSGSPVFYVAPAAIVEVGAFLSEDAALKFDYLMSLTAVDWPDRFETVYHLYSIAYKHYVTLKVKVGKADPTLPSVYPVWKAADWQEREVYDMFGISFVGHPDLRRILLEPEWEGFPLRKDYVEK